MQTALLNSIGVAPNNTRKEAVANNNEIIIKTISKACCVL